MIANARMYSVTPEVADLWRGLLEALGNAAGVDLAVVSHAPPAPLAELWQREDKAAVFMCGLPFSRGAFAAQLLAAPVPSPAAFQGLPCYWSELLVRRDSGFRTLEDTFGHRIAFTVADSQSGYAAALNHLRAQQGEFPRQFPHYGEVVAPRVTPLGALTAVIQGFADVAPVDSYAFALLEKYSPELTAQVRSVARTEPTPIPPLISSPGSFGALQAAFLDAHRSAKLRPIMEALLLQRFVLPDPRSYDRLSAAFEQSLAYWRRHPLASIVHPAFL
jgi:ABC-type phosphate/phosphonate transport system substrate-binding protein